MATSKKGEFGFQPPPPDVIGWTRGVKQVQFNMKDGKLGHQPGPPPFVVLSSRSWELDPPEEKESSTAQDTLLGTTKRLKYDFVETEYLDCPGSVFIYIWNKIVSSPPTDWEKNTPAPQFWIFASPGNVSKQHLRKSTDFRKKNIEGISETGFCDEYFTALLVCSLG